LGQFLEATENICDMSCFTYIAVTGSPIDKYLVDKFRVSYIYHPYNANIKQNAIDCFLYFTINLKTFYLNPDSLFPLRWKMLISDNRHYYYFVRNYLIDDKGGSRYHDQATIIPGINYKYLKFMYV
jgi:hypothetical protein